MTRTDLLNIIASAIRRNFTTASEEEALEAAEEVLSEFEIVGLKIEKRPPSPDRSKQRGRS
ncbi:MAG: hypothetical protein L0210_15325 [Rhodospirillales bacterium]|nr:hypothetical protein [Rhodospirillales bacterium]